MAENTDTAARSTLDVGLPADEAYRAFADEIGRWWPPEYTWSAQSLEDIRLDPRPGGLCSEYGPDGFRCDWGRVLAWEPPHRLVLAWQISPQRAPQPDPSEASEVEIRFVADGDTTRLDLEHRHFERHGDGAAEYLAAMDSPEGWDRILAQFSEHAATRS